MDFARTTGFMARIWDEEIIPALTDYIRIPNKSPSFDADWATARPYGKGCDYVRRLGLAKLQQFEGSSLEVVRLEGRTPLIFIEIPGSAPGADSNVWSSGQAAGDAGLG